MDWPACMFRLSKWQFRCSWRPLHLFDLANFLLISTFTFTAVIAAIFTFVDIVVETLYFCLYYIICLEWMLQELFINCFFPTILLLFITIRALFPSESRWNSRQRTNSFFITAKPRFAYTDSALVASVPHRTYTRKVIDDLVIWIFAVIALGLVKLNMAE